MASYEEVARRWKLIALGLEHKGQLRNPRMPIRGDRIFSYGSHFELARLIRDKKGNPESWLLNGDRSTMTTMTSHQPAIRSVLSFGPGSDLPRVTIPHQALAAAGIDFDSIRILEVTPDRNIEHNVTTYEFPEGARWRDDEIIDTYEKWGDVDKDGNLWEDSMFAEPQPERRYNEQSFDAYWPLDQAWRKRLAAFREERGVHRAVIQPMVSHIKRNLYVNSRTRWNRWDVTVTSDGRTRYSRTYSQHVLGASLISAEVVYSRTVKCPACNGSGGAPEPWQDPWEVRRYQQALADWEESHEEWDARHAEQLKVFREKWGEESEPPPWLTTPTAPPAPVPFHSQCQQCGGRRRIPAPAGRRRAKFLSGFDANESRPSYFFCELPPRCKANTVEEAYEALKPESVRLAEQMGRTVLRQGDIFAIPLESVTKRALTKQGARFEKKGRLFNTNHAATEVAYLPGGVTIARGTLRHVPEFRQPDHRMVSLGKQWFVVQKNTVPIVKAAR